MTTHRGVHEPSALGTAGGAVCSGASPVPERAGPTRLTGPVTAGGHFTGGCLFGPDRLLWARHSSGGLGDRDHTSKLGE